MEHPDEIVSPKEAKARGLLYYFTGSVCRHGHVAKRHVANGQCYDCTLIRARERSRRLLYETRDARRETRLAKAAARVVVPAAA